MALTSALQERQTLTQLLYQSPYNAAIYHDRAACYVYLGFPDLAASDAYRALLLTDEVLDASGEYHEQAFEAILNATSKAHRGLGSINGDVSEKDIDPDHVLAAEKEARRLALASFETLGSMLSRCGCLRSAYDFCSRGLQTFPRNRRLEEIRDQIRQTHYQNQLHRDSAWDSSDFDPRRDLTEQGSVRRELYPWNTHEPDRFSDSSLIFLNSEMHKVAPKCEVLAVSLPLLREDNDHTYSNPAGISPTITQLGIFAKEDIAPGEAVLHESSILTANNRLHDPLCDACSSELPADSSNVNPACPNCDDTVFCSTTCYSKAISFYHPAICGKADYDVIGKDTDPKAAANALYLLLLGRAMALSQTQGIHPLDLPETKYIWGDFIHVDNTYLHSTSTSAFNTARHLPFNFNDNILAPLHMLEKMDVDIFTALDRCDAWVVNTLYAKFRGTASARLSMKDGRPEVCAVHPMWCLANHSCAPNVKWEWGGEIRFSAREEGEIVRWGKDGGRGQRKGGIAKGAEVLSHYCDVDLGVSGRREWAVGALGGICICDRCLWEEKEQERKMRGENGVT